MRRFFTVLCVVMTFYCKSQILDDSTKTIYGPETTLYFLEEDLYNNDKEARPIDTVLTGHQRFGIVQESGFKYQNLGNIGTAATPIFPSVPRQIGARSGFYVYDYAFDDASTIRYYNTKSPYIDAELNLGGNGRSELDIEYARNVNPQWNVGFDLTLYRVDKQVGEDQTRGDRNAESDDYYFFSSYNTKDSAYFVLGSYSRMNHLVNETGGVVFDPEENIFEDFFDDDAEIHLRNSISRDSRNQFHLYQQYQFSKYAQLYHIYDQQKQSNFFTSLASSEDATFLGTPLIATDTTFDKSKLRTWENEFGIKGDIGSIFYRLYYKRRDVKFIYRYLPTIGPFTENYAGLTLRYDRNDDLSVGLEGEALSDGFFWFKASARYKFAEVRLENSRQRPSFIAEGYFGNYDEWNNNFEPVNHQSIEARATLEPFRGIKLTPKAKYQEVAKPIFWNFEAEPEQTPNSAFIFTGGIEADINFLKNMYFNGEVLYTTVSGQGGDVFRIPEIFYQGTLYYRNRAFKKRILFEFGVDTHWKSTYFANAYDPVVQQFHLQNELEVPAYLLIDLFLNFKVNRTMFTLKLNQFSQGLVDPGYLVTPFYIGTPGTFDLLITWPFFD